MSSVTVVTTTLILGEKDLFSEAVLLEERRETRAETGPTETRRPARWRQCCERVAADYDLSPREAEVMLLLAKGRSIEHIQETLVITYSTAKSHTNHIYRKLNVHSREELIELVERQRGCGSPDVSNALKE